MNDSERLKDLLWKERDDLQHQLDRLTAVHTVDLDDYSHDLVDDNTRIVYARITEDGQPSYMQMGTINCIYADKRIFPRCRFVYSEHAPSLQAHLEKLKAE